MKPFANLLTMLIFDAVHISRPVQPTQIVHWNGRTTVREDPSESIECLADLLNVLATLFLAKPDFVKLALLFPVKHVLCFTFLCELLLFLIVADSFRAKFALQIFDNLILLE